MSSSEISQNERITTLQDLAKSGDLRIAATARNCFYYVSDVGKERLQQMGLDVEPPRELPALTRDFKVGNTPHFIKYETMRHACGNRAVSDVLRGYVGMIARSEDAARHL